MTMTMTNMKTPPVPKDERPDAIERLLREYRRDHPGAWMPWSEVLAHVGGSERDFAKMMRAAKDRIRADEAVISAAPEMPEDMKEEFERFILGLWKRACDLADVSASELRRARQIDRESTERERAEIYEMIEALVRQRDDLGAELEKTQAEATKTADHLSAVQAELRETRAARDEVRSLFADMTGKQAGDDDATETDSSDAKTQARRKSRAKASSQESDHDGNANADDTLSPELPLT